MANRNAKLIERTLKDFSLGVMSGSGGTEVVTKLPEVGEEHTIYELHQNVEPAYNWVAKSSTQMETDGVGTNIYYLFIFDTYESFNEMVYTYYTWEAGGTDLDPCLCYIRNDDKLYRVLCDPEVQTVIVEVEKLGAYTFNFRFLEQFTIYVLKSYEGYDETSDTLKGTLLNGDKINLENSKAFILTQVNYAYMDSGVAMHNIYKVSTLPAASEAVANYLDELIANAGLIEVEIDGKIKDCSPDNGYYYWDEELHNFYIHSETSDDQIYTGALEWRDEGNYPFYDEIPFKDIFFGEYSGWYFHPKKGGVEISYWIYSNDTWTNVDDIGKPSGFTIPLTSKGNSRDGIDGLSFDNFEITVNGKTVQLDEYFTVTGSETHNNIVGCISGIEVPTDEQTLYTMKISVKDPSIINPTGDIIGIGITWYDDFIGSLEFFNPSYEFELGTFDDIVGGKLELNVQVSK